MHVRATAEASAASFRDPSGRVFTYQGRVLRHIQPCYARTYDRLMQEGLYRELVERGLLVAHEEIDPATIDGPQDAMGAYRIIEPERIPFISYPYEWPFAALKAAALATLRIQRAAIHRGLTLKDASAYNVQFVGSHPVFIDTLSFESWEEGTPWVAYRQFCQHFLGPLALMSHAELRLGQLSRVFIDGPPLDLVSRLLPWHTRLKPALLMHLHLHARAQEKHGRSTAGVRSQAFGRRAMLGLIDHLESAVGGLVDRDARGPWVDYYAHTHNYTAEAMADKHRLVASVIERVAPRTVWDLGANTGAFSRLAAERGAYTLAFDGDGAAVDRHFADCVSRNDRRILPLVLDLANPSGAIGWAHEERLSLLDRGPADLVLALGLVHHLRIANQVPFPMIAELFHRVGRSLVVELPLPADSQVEGMLARQPAFKDGYSQEAFEQAFAPFFAIEAVHPIAQAHRRLYLMRAIGTPGRSSSTGTADLSHPTGSQ